MNNDSDYSGKERRKVARIRGILVEFRLADSEDEFQGVFLRDMSLKGASFTTATKLAVGDKLEINIFLTDAKNPAQVRGQVRWVEKSAYFQIGDNIHFDAGVEITNIDDNNVKALEKYMTEHEADQ